jgi:hypothetical protein
MATEINIATYDENGVPVCRPMTDDELAEFLAFQKEAQENAPTIPA